MTFKVATFNHPILGPVHAMRDSDGSTETAWYEVEHEPKGVFVTLHGGWMVFDVPPSPPEQIEICQFPSGERAVFGWLENKKVAAFLE